MNETISEENYTYSFFEKDDLRMFVSVGGESLKDNSEVNIIYYVTIVDRFDHDVSQKTYNSLSEAITFTLAHCHDWNFINTKRPSKCHSCHKDLTD